MEQTAAAPTGTPTVFPLDTDAFASLNGVKGQTVRKRLCETGSYFGVMPRKLANRRLAWPAVQIEAGAAPCN